MNLQTRRALPRWMINTLLVLLLVSFWCIGAWRLLTKYKLENRIAQEYGNMCRAYPLPNEGLRYCIRKLKTLPAEETFTPVYLYDVVGLSPTYVAFMNKIRVDSQKGAPLIWGLCPNLIDLKAGVFLGHEALSEVQLSGYARYHAGNYFLQKVPKNAAGKMLDLEWPSFSAKQAEPQLDQTWLVECTPDLEAAQEWKEKAGRVKPPYTQPLPELSPVRVRLKLTGEVIDVTAGTKSGN